MSQPSTSLAVVNASSTQLAQSVRGFWIQRERRGKERASPELDTEGWVDDVFLALALIGEALLPLGVLDDAHYHDTLFEVQTAIGSCGYSHIADLFEKLEYELKYLVTAGFTMCAVFAPMHVYRGFGACVFGDWNWGCPDAEFLDKKVKKETGMFSKKPDPQPNRSVLLAFDRAIQLLQVKSTAFLSKRPSISAFAEQHPRYGPRPKKEIKDAFSDCEDFGSEIERRGHPAPPGQKVSSWGMPWAGWTSTFSWQLTKDWELVMFNQMDPGRLLHAFTCRGSLNLDVEQLIILPPATPAESLICWLASLPGATHKVVGWDAFMTSEFEKKAGKKLTKKIGHYPLPSKFVIRDPNAPPPSAVVSPRMSMPSLLTRTRTLSRSITPPPYSPALSDETIGENTFPRPEKAHTFPGTDEDEVHAGPSNAAELRRKDPPELSAYTTHVSPTASGFGKHSSSTPALSTGKSLVSPANSPPPTLPTSATLPARRKPPPPPPGNGANGTRVASVTSPVTNGHANGSASSLASAANENAPPRPPKVPLELDSAPVSGTTISQLETTRSNAVSPMQTDLSAHYLRLLNDVAQGRITPQQLQELLRHGAPVSTLTAEPQELECIPRPPKFAGVTIPPGEIRGLAQSNGIGEDMPVNLKPG